MSRATALNDYLAKTPMTSVVVNLSGGIDSAVTVALAYMAS